MTENIVDETLNRLPNWVKILYFIVTVIILSFIAIRVNQYYLLAQDCCNNYEKICLKVNTSYGYTYEEIKQILERIHQAGINMQNQTTEP